MSTGTQSTTLEAAQPPRRGRLLENTSQFLSRSLTWLRKTLRPSPTELSARRFMAYCRKKWPWNPAVKHDRVVVVSLFPHRLAIYCNAHAANAMARRAGAGIEAYKITTNASTIIQEIYASFGASVGLDASWAESERPRLEKEANDIFSNLQTKWDLLGIRYDGLKIGDTIYDSYLRYFMQPTVDLKDPRLRDIIFNALLVYTATSNYMKARKVVGFIADDYSYHEAGIITRLMLRANVPVYIVCYGPEHFLYRLFTDPETGGADYPVRWPYHQYRKLFRSMPLEEQTACREKGRQHLDRKLSGELDRFTLIDITAYGKSTERVFEDTGKKRVVILMHDFFDSPHGYRWMLFPDFYEWVSFLFERASETDFEWYMKPHPSSWNPQKKLLNAHNRAAVEKLRERFPKIKFLEPSISNRQIVQEGICAMFTMYGTAGHEFARMGVPVVNGGDNPHIAYDFNYHPRTAEEYGDLIARADQLTVSGSHDDIAEYVYMNYYYFLDHCSTTANPFPPSIFADPAYELNFGMAAGFDHLIFPDDPEREAAMDRYYDELFANHIPKQP